MSTVSLEQPGAYRAKQHGVRTLWVWIIPAVIAILFQMVFAQNINGYYYNILVNAGINIVLAVSLNLVNGFTGQFSMGHAGFMSVGGYTAAFLSIWLRSKHPEIWTSLTSNSGGSGFSLQALPGMFFFMLILGAGGLAASAAGYLVGLPSLRLKGDYLAIVTLGFGEIIRVVVLNVKAVGGATGLADIPSLTNSGWVYFSAVLCVFTIWRLVNSSHGRAFLAVREDEIAAEAMGVNTTRAKVRAFVIGAFFAGVAGGLFAHYLQYLNPQTFDFNKSFEIIIMVVLGGMGSITGSVVAALFLTGAREGLRALQQFTGQDYRMIIYSLMLILLMLTRPNGLFGTREFTDFLPGPLKRKLLGSRKSEVA